MENVYNVAQLICDEYEKVSGQKIDEMKLHKLLYFTQRESLAIVNEPMFNAEFEGWMLGPVCRAIRTAKIESEKIGDSSKVSFPSAYIVRNDISEYGGFESWRLSEISHRELSWRNSREGLSPKENGNRVLELSDIRIDAKKVRLYDHLYDMYYDEFDDYEESA